MLILVTPRGNIHNICIYECCDDLKYNNVQCKNHTVIQLQNMNKIENSYPAIHGLVDIQYTINCQSKCILRMCIHRLFITLIFILKQQ